MGTAASSPAGGDIAGAVDGGRQTAVDHQEQQQQQQQQEKDENSGGAWDVNLGIPFNDINGLRSLADGTACT